MEEGWFPGNPEGNYGIDHERLCPIRSGMDLAQDSRRQLVQLATALRRCLCCDLGQVTGGLVIRRAKIELIKIVSKEYIESLKRNYLKSD